MPEGPMEVPMFRLRELIELANRIFRPGGGDMGWEYPLVFDSERPDAMRVILEDGKIVSHVGVCIRDSFILGASVRIASIGAVCTDPKFRGRNFAGALLDDAIAWGRECQADLMLISGDRSLYRRAGASRPGRFTSIEGVGDKLPPGLAVEKAGSGEIPSLAALYQREPVRFERPSEDWDRLLTAGMLMNRQSDCWIVRDSEQVLAYLGVQRPPSHSEGETRPSVMEYAGSRDAVWSALGAVAENYGSTSAIIALMPEDVDLLGRARRAGLPIHETGFTGTVIVLNADELITSVQAIWRERHGRDAVDLLDIQFDQDSISYQTPIGRRIRLEGPALTAAIFGPERGREDEHSVLPGMSPIPLPWYGYNYV